MEGFEEKILQLKELTKTSTNPELARALGVSPKTIYTWKERGKIPEKIFLKARHDSQNVSSDVSGMVELTYYDVEASAGHGSLIEVETAKEMSFAERYLRDELHVNPNEVFLMRAKGDSMYPTLKDGSLIMIKRVHDFSGDGVYVFRVNGQVMVKRLQFQPTKIIFKSDNSQFYEPWELTHKEIESTDFQILGQAVWGGGKL
ncbi:helix-turn-helix domain-containing protein [Vibrio parahaemolyticus]|nr:transcriptional regulator [Vibrio parahaemolyticus]EJG0655198.1 helix-turn-helix domain-containing protein [Vibrio parahaemolyticus]EJG0772124.1 helix-turn-helix domain-containing protein [Vibrio parahaemolyticus]EJG0805062.1 helix-turn-helix domain-containing protein [Vibrio parahaemolyticus]EJG0956904.1 helix-turn-helix domain-containing protein [Vibrio parahaemolyticus]